MLSKAEQEAIIQSCYDAVFGYCLSRLHSEDAALEVTQDTFLLMVEKAANLSDDLMKYWLLSVAEHKCAAYLRRQHREDGHLRLDDPETDVLDALSAKLDDRCFGAYYERYLAQLMHRLSEKEALLCELRFIRGYSPARIAALLQIREDAVNTRVSRLKKKMERIIREELLLF